MYQKYSYKWIFATRYQCKLWK